MNRLVFAGVVAGLLSVPWLARADPPSEYHLKAAFVYNFAKFVEWPASAFDSSQAPMHLCIAGTDPFGPILTSVEHKTAQGHELVLKRVPPDPLGACHIVFVSGSKEQVTRVLSAAADMKVLTVSDVEDFAGLGGMIGLVTNDNKIQFDINLDAAQRAELRLSPQLLKLARSVRR
jgi:YfiR/HmsC-like